MLIDLCTLAIPAFSLSLALSLGPFLGPGFPFPLLPKKKYARKRISIFFSICLARFFATRLGEIAGSWKQISPPKKKLQ